MRDLSEVVEVTDTIELVTGSLDPSYENRLKQPACQSCKKILTIAATHVLKQVKMIIFVFDVFISCFEKTSSAT